MQENIRIHGHESVVEDPQGASEDIGEEQVFVQSDAGTLQLPEINKTYTMVRHGHTVSVVENLASTFKVYIHVRRRTNTSKESRGYETYNINKSL